MNLCLFLLSGKIFLYRNIVTVGDLNLLVYVDFRLSVFLPDYLLLLKNPMKYNLKYLFYSELHNLKVVLINELILYMK